MSDIQSREAIIQYAHKFNSSGLSVGKSGNISARSEKGFLITPTGFNYKELNNPEDICHCDIDGNIIEGKWAPSSEWQVRSDIYKKRTDSKAVVHCHSTYATALACCNIDIPSFHYMIAIVGGGQIKCADYATFGTRELSENVIKALGERKACLLANHGQLTVSDSVENAFRLAEEVENLAKQYCISIHIGNPVLLDDAEMQRNLEKFKLYGKKNQHE